MTKQDPFAKTPLDEALEFARTDPNQGGLFYDTFLNSLVFVPVLISGQNQASWKKLSLNEKFHPMFLNYEGAKVIPAFHPFSRLEAWAQGKMLDYMEIRCHELLKTVAPGTGLALNLGSQWAHYFAPETLEQLRNAMRPVTPS